MGQTYSAYKMKRREIKESQIKREEKRIRDIQTQVEKEKLYYQSRLIVRRQIAEHHEDFKYDLTTVESPYSMYESYTAKKYPNITIKEIRALWINIPHCIRAEWKAGNKKNIENYELADEIPSQNVFELTDEIPSQNVYGHTSPMMPPILADHNQKLDIDEKSSCLICMNQTKNTLFMPCRHLSACYDCTKIITSTSNKCPICREDIKETILFYNC